VQNETPVHHSNVMAYSTKEKVRSRIGMKCAPPRPAPARRADGPARR